MSSVIQFRFGSAKTLDTVSFSGLMIKLLELKRAIVEKRQLMRGHLDFDLQVSNVQTGEVYNDDDMMIGKNTTVIVRRVPATKAGGLLSRLEGGGSLQTNRGAGRGPKPIEVSGQRPEPPTDPRRRHAAQTDDATAAALAGAREAIEEYKPKTSFQQRAQRTNQQQQQPAPQRGMLAGCAVINTHQQQEQFTRGATPLGNYRCHRCGKTGHFIRDCPEKGNMNDNLRPGEQQRFRQGVAGVPRTFWKEAPVDSTNTDNTEGDQLNNTQVVGIAPARDRFDTLVRRGFVQGVDMDPSKIRAMASAEAPTHFRCPICNRIFEDAVVTPCCGDTACDQCIRDGLVRSGGACPLCSQPLQAERLLPNKQIRAAVDTFLVKWSDDQKRREAQALAAEEQAAGDEVSGQLVAGQHKPDAVLDLGAGAETAPSQAVPLAPPLDEDYSGYNQQQDDFGNNNHPEDEFGGDVFAARHHTQIVQPTIPPVPVPLAMGADEMSAAAALADTKLPASQPVPEHMYPPQPGDQPPPQQYQHMTPAPPPMQQQQEFAPQMPPAAFPPGGMMPQFAPPQQQMPPFMGYPPDFMGGPPRGPPMWQQPPPQMQHMQMQPPPMNMQTPWMQPGLGPGMPPSADYRQPLPLPPPQERVFTFDEFCDLAREERRRFGRRRFNRGGGGGQRLDSDHKRQRRGDDDQRYIQQRKRSPSPSSRRASRRRDRSASRSDEEQPPPKVRRQRSEENETRYLSDREKRRDEPAIQVDDSIVFGAHIPTPPHGDDDQRDDLDLPPPADDHAQNNDIGVD